MEIHTPLKQLSDIPDSNYIGYYQMSDNPSPVPVDGPFNPPLKGNNPFVVEANLFAKDGSASYSILHNNGQYLIHKTDWKNIPNIVVLKEQGYLIHRLKEHQEAIFMKAWIPVVDPLCAGMEVLQPVWRAFKGFVK